MANEMDMMDLDENGFDDLFGAEATEGSIPKRERNITKKALQFFQKLPVQLSLEVSSTEIPLGELMKICEGSVVQLDKMSNQPLDVKVNGTLIGTAEVVMIDGHYGLRMIEINDDANLADLA